MAKKRFRRPKGAAAVMTAVAIVALFCVPTYLGVITRGQREEAVQRIRTAPALLQAEHALARYDAQARSQDAGLTGGLIGVTFSDAIERPSQDEDFQGILKDFADDAPPSEEEWSKLGTFLEKQRALITAVGTVAVQGKPWYTLAEDPAAEKLKHLMPMQDCAQLLALQCAFDRHLDDISAALEDLQAIYAWGEILASEPLVISQLVRNQIHGVAMATLERNFRPGELTGDQSRQLVALLRGKEYREGFRQGLYWEASMLLGAYETSANGTADLNQVTFLAQPTWRERLLQRVYASSWGETLRNLDAAAYAESMSRMAEACGQPFFRSRATFQELEAESGDLPRRRVLARSSLAALLPCMTAPARAEVMRDLTCLGLNVEAHRAEHGELPRALEEVMPAQQLPLDPFGGQHYRYLHTQEGFFLYSLGPDGVDDGGKQTEDSPLHVEQGDITWRASR